MTGQSFTLARRLVGGTEMLHHLWIPGFATSQALTIIIILFLALIDLPELIVMVRRERANLIRGHAQWRRAGSRLVLLR